jgi:hypothetical protein
MLGGVLMSAVAVFAMNPNTPAHALVSANGASNIFQDPSYLEAAQTVLSDIANINVHYLNSSALSSEAVVQAPLSPVQ